MHPTTELRKMMRRLVNEYGVDSTTGSTINMAEALLRSHIHECIERREENEKLSKDYAALLDVARDMAEALKAGEEGCFPMNGHETRMHGLTMCREALAKFKEFDNE